MKTLVTGGAGFIGSHLSERLLAGGHDVVIADNLATGRMSNIAHFLEHPRLKFCQVDIRDSQQLSGCFTGVDWVFHLAGIADIVPSVEWPELYFSTNVSGTCNVLECARSAGVKRLVYAASSSGYGIPALCPTPETSPMNPLYPYALTKYLGEQLVLHWARVYSLSALSLRLFSVYGPRSRTTGAYGSVCGVFFSQKLHGKPLTVVGDGTQTRDFTYVTDAVDAFVRAAWSSASGEALNVGSGTHHSINELAELLGGNVVHLPKRPGEPHCTCADVTRIEQVLRWRATVPFEEGVMRTLQQLSDWHDAPLWDPKSIGKATEPWFRHLGEHRGDPG
ncbi:MAG: SDR family oxidoreductase [Burkholderiales bacterium]|nr:SDR family oxidoreductase [Burkholderiales bacterium]